MSLWEFSRKFCDFRSIFRAFKQFLDVFWNCFRIKNKFEKKQQNLSYQIGPSPWARPNPLRPSRLARRGPSSRPEAEADVAGQDTAAGRPCPAQLLPATPP
jgi:hypothetical protein